MVRVVPSEERTSVLHVERTTLAAVISQVVARWLHLPEPYWATVTAIVVMQSTLGAAWNVSVKRFAGTALGAFMAGLIASYLPPGIFVFAITLFATGLICLGLRLDRTAYRFAGITVVIVMLVAREKTARIIALHRFGEVSLGIAVALMVTAAWPERFDTAPANEAKQPGT